MKINKIRNMSTNVISGLFFRIVSIVFPFIIRTIIIKVLSSEYLGLSSLFTSVLQALNLMELGLGSALVFNMYEHVANNNIEKLSNYMSFYKKCYRFIGIAILILGLMVLPFITYFIKGQYPNDINIYVLYLIYLFNTVISYLLFAYKNSIALAYQKTSIENISTLISHILMYIFQIILLIYTKNYYFYAIMIPIFTLLKNIIVSYQIDKYYPNIKPKGNISKEERTIIINNIKALFGHQIAFTVINSADNIILSKMLGLTDLAIYNNYYYIMSALINIMTIIFNSIQAGIGNNIIVDDKSLVYENYKKFRFFVYSIVCIFSTTMFACYNPFMKIWMGNDYVLPLYAALAFSFGFYVTQIRRVVTTYKNASGLWKQDFLKPYIWIVLDIALDIILIPKVGVIGAILATSISAIIVAIPVETVILYKNIFQKKALEHLKFMLKEFLLYLISLVTVYFLIKIYMTNAYLFLIYCLFVGLIVPLTYNFIFKHNAKEFIWIIQRIKILIKEIRTGKKSGEA